MKKGDLDGYYRQAKSSGYVARSVFKLMELDLKLRLFKSGQRVLDLGASPGSWVQYIADRIAPNGTLVAIDCQPLSIAPMERLTFVEMDIYQLDPRSVREDYGLFDIVVSDLGPKTTGNRTVDHMRSMQLCKKAIEISDGVLKPGGDFLCKMFEGEDTADYMKEMKAHFVRVSIEKPKASRKESREIYIFGKSYLGG